MPKIISYTPSWLSRSSPGFDVFTSSQATKNPGATNGKGPRAKEHGHRHRGAYLGPGRTIARRGTEIFLVVENQIRWSDLCMLKDDWEEWHNKERSERRGNMNRKSKGPNERRHRPPTEGSYRVGVAPYTVRGRSLPTLLIDPQDSSQ